MIPKFPSYEFRGSLTPGEETNLSKKNEPGEDKAISIYCIKFCPWAPAESPIFAFVSENYIYVYSIDEASGNIQCLIKIADPKNTEIYYSLDWSHRKDNEVFDLILAAGGSSMKIQIINVSSGVSERTLASHMDDIYDLKFHPILKFILLSASKDCSIRLWNTDNGEQIAIYTGVDGHTGGVNCIDWHDDGELFISGGMDYSVKIWKITPEVKDQINESMKYKEPNKKFPLYVCLAAFSTCKVHNSYVDCVKFHGNLLLSKSVYEGISLWLPNMKHSPVFLLMKIRIQYPF